MIDEDALTPGDKEVMLQGWSESVKDQLAEGIHKDEIIKQITATGLEHDTVAKFVEDLDQILHDPYAEQKSLAKEYSNSAATGACLIIGGGLLSIIGGFKSPFISLLVVIAFFVGFFKFVTGVVHSYQIKRKIPKPPKS